MGRVEIISSAGNSIVFGLSIEHKDISSLYNLTVKFGEQFEVIDAEIQPRIPVSDIIEEAANINDFGFLIREIMERLHNYIKTKEELSGLDTRISRHWKVKNQEVTFTFQDISCVVLLPWEYPTNLEERPKILLLKINGVTNTQLQVEINELPNLTLQQVVSKVFEVKIR